MALNDNIKKLREEKTLRNSSWQINYMFQGKLFVAGKMVRDVQI